MRGSRLALCGLAAALLLPACGGGEEGAAAEIEAALTTAATSLDPANCRRLLTDRYLEQAFKQQPEAALDACEESLLEEEEDLPDGIAITAIEVEGDSAVAKITDEGGDFDGQTYRIGMVEMDGAWMLDELVEFVDLDRDAVLLEIGRDAYEEARTGEEARRAQCALERFEELDVAELEEILLSRSVQPLWNLVRTCEPRSQSV